MKSKYDVNLMFVLFLLFVMSCIHIHYAQELSQYEINFVSRQVIFFVVAAIIGFIFIHFDYEYYLNLTWVLYGMGLILLLLLEIAPESIAPPTYGAVRWFRVPIIGSFQPSELTKIFTIIALSTVIFKHNKIHVERNTKTDIHLILKMLAVVIPPILFYLRQPDTGIIMLTGSVFIFMLMASGITYKIILPLIVIPLVGIFTFLATFFYAPWFLEKFVFSFMHDYQVRRFYGWLQPFDYPDEGYQAAQAMLSIGSGKLSGGNGKVYLPEAHTDFIFAIVGNESGFIGTSFLMLLYLMLCYLITQIAIKSDNAFGTYLCVGIVGMFVYQIFQNIGMNIGLLPVTGFTLPFMSYGGTSLMASMFAISIVMSVKYHNKDLMFQFE